MYFLIRNINHNVILNNNYKRKLLLFNLNNNHNFYLIIKKNLSVLFFGTDKFSIPSLENLALQWKKQNYITKLGVVTSIKNHLNPVAKYAQKEKLKIYNWPINPDLIQEEKYDLGIVVSFGHLIPESIITKFPLEMINVHASLLPRWRGAAPIIYALLNGDSKTGVTIMKIRPHHFDIGEILVQKEVSISKSMLMPDLHDELSETGSQLLLTCIKDIQKYLSNATPQDLVGVTYAPKIDQKFATIDFNKMTSEDIYNHYRAFYNYKPLIIKWFNYNIKLVKINIELNYNNSIESNKVIGKFEFVKSKKCLRVQCADNTFINIYQLIIEGKKVMTAQDFNNGFLKKNNQS